MGIGLWEICDLGLGGFQLRLPPSWYPWCPQSFETVSIFALITGIECGLHGLRLTRGVAVVARAAGVVFEIVVVGVVVGRAAAVVGVVLAAVARSESMTAATWSKS